MRRSVCPGSFDPVTNGHLDVINRAAQLCDEVLVAVLVNDAKQPMFDADVRVEMLREATQSLSNVEVEPFAGLVVDYCRARDASVIVKGLRAGGDFDYELQMAQMNARLSGVETVFFATDPAYSFVSSSLVKDVARHGGDVSSLVPEAVVQRLPHR